MPSRESVQTSLNGMLSGSAGDNDEAAGLIIDVIEQHLSETENVHEKIEFTNRLRQTLKDHSPLDEPIDNVQWVPNEQVEGNDYNPNEVASPEMDLLYKSIEKDGYTQPIVTYRTGDSSYEVVDGFHRTLVGKEKDDITERLRGYVPVTIIDKPKDERMGSTIRHNRARGTHQIRDMSSLVTNLVERGWSDERIGDELGMEFDEVLRLKQVSGLKEAFSGHEFSQSWTEYEDRLEGDRECEDVDE